MPEGDGGHSIRPGRVLRTTTAGAVMLVLASALASYQFNLGPRWFGFDYPSPVTAPAMVAPPAGLTLPTAGPAAAVSQETNERSVDPAKVRRALAALVASKKLGRHVAVDVDQLVDGASVYRHGARLVAPASTMKLLTTTAALEALGPDHRFSTTVVASANSKRIVLMGGGDPLLGRAPVDTAYPARADLATLAGTTAKALKGLGRTTVRLGYDTSLFTGPAVNPRWEPSYVPDNVVSPVSPLWVDEGRQRTGLSARSTDPAADAAEAFALALGTRHITVLGKPASMTAPTDATEVATVQSAPLAQIVQHILEVSDNEGAEVLGRQVALAEGLPASFAGGSRAVRAVLGRLRIDTSGGTILDGSGLSRHDRLHPQTLLDVIETASSPDHPELRPVVVGLPVAGFSGSLTYRFETGDPEGLGMVRAKTGTLTGVHGLAGTVTSADGAVMSFVAIADKVKLKFTLDARAKLDEIAAALAGCSCAESGAAASATP